LPEFCAKEDIMVLIEPDAVARIDAATIASGIPGYRLMRTAGHAVAAAALRRWPAARRFVVLAGPGNNGGDGYVAAGILRDSGAAVAAPLKIAPSRRRRSATTGRRKAT
jgi:NAD(P)H-hydrate epimerase